MVVAGSRTAVAPLTIPQRLVAFLRTYWLPVSFAAGGVAARLVFWFMTDRKFEDALTTVMHAQNAASGDGLVHHLGEPEPQHGFTSAVSVLVPLVGELVQSGRGITTLRLAGLAAFCAAIAFAYLICRKLALGPWITGFVLAYLAFDQNQIFYGMAGMETQIAVAVLLFAVWAVWEARPVVAGIALGLCLLTRPDFLVFVVPAITYLAWKHRPAVKKAALVATGVVAPWLLFTTIYYGSPLPATISAKVSRYIDPPSLLDGPVEWGSFVVDQVRAHDFFWYRFSPFFEFDFTQQAPISSFILVSLVAALAVLAGLGAYAMRSRSEWWPALVAVGGFLLYAVLFLPDNYYDWYWPPFMALFMITVAIGLRRFQSHGPRTAVAVAVLLAVLFSIHMPFSFPLEARVQQIEDRVRTPIAFYIRDHVPKDEGVVSESAGYIGYFGRPLLWDYPGLTSHTARTSLEGVPNDRHSLFTLIELLQPHWIVLRGIEYDQFRGDDPEFAADYAEVMRITIGPDDPSLVRWGLNLINIDRDFVLLRRTTSRPAALPGPSTPATPGPPPGNGGG